MRWSVVLLAAGCSGVIGDPEREWTPPAVTPDPVVPTPIPPPKEPPREPPPFAPAPATIHRLTRAQYAATVRDILGADVEVPTDLEVDTPIYGFASIGAAQLTIAPRAAEQYEAAAYALAAQVFAAEKRRAFTGCTNPDEACVRSFLPRFGARAFRRPLDTAEVDRWTGVASTVARQLADPWKGLEYAVAGLLQSPHFLHRVDIGVPDGDRRRFSGHELAARLSYFLWGTTPDDALLARAETLDSEAALRAEARRMLESPQAREAVDTFFTEYLKLDRLDLLNKDPREYPQMSETLGASMREEILRTIEALVFEDGDFRDLFTTRTTFVNEELGRLYTMNAPRPGMSRVELPADGARAGLLTTGGFLALNAHASATSPTLRGRFIRQFLLCQDIPQPPAGVVTNIPEDDGEPRTLRERLEALHLVNPTCASCHKLMDPIGFGLEAFDAIGAYRTTDNGRPIDPRGSLDGRAYRSARQLGEAVREHPRLAGCVTRMAYRFATGHLESEGEERPVRAATERFVDAGHRFDALLVEVAASDGFRFARLEQE